jgi:phosphohistidine phosphatase
MLTLTLFRHAKAEMAVAGQSDFDRPLMNRGRVEAALAGKTLSNLELDRALISAATRTRETWAFASREILTPPGVEIDPDLYSCTPQKLISILRGVHSSDSSIVVVGHNPIIHEVAAWLTGDDMSPDADILRLKFPTSALAIFDIDSGSWASLTAGRAKLRAFVIPR